ncbi:MAG: hypothetical protein U1F42_02175 [Candidatus Competibacteraceae bacterium]
MSAPEPTSATAPAPSSLLRRLFRLSDVGFYLMIVLAWIGAIYTTYDVNSSRWYWHWLIPIFGLICIVTQWNNVDPTLKARLALVTRQLLHWGAVLLLAFLIYMLSGQNHYVDLLDDRQASFMLTFTVALSTYLAGIYYDWRLCVVAAFIITGATLNVALSNTAPLLMWIGLGVAVSYFVWAWWYNRRQVQPPALSR